MGVAQAQKKRGRPPARAQAVAAVASLVEKEREGEEDAHPPPEARARVQAPTGSARSWVWNFFTATSDPGKFMCRVCALVDKTKKGGHGISIGDPALKSSSNLYTHLRHGHPDLQKKIDEAEESETLQDKSLAEKFLLEVDSQALARTLDGWVTRTPHPTAETLDIAIALWAIKAGIPWNVFNSDAWDRVRRLSEKALPSGDTLRRTTFPKVYELVHRCIMTEMLGVEGCSATSDSWSDGEKSLVSLTVDFVDSDLVAHSRCGGSLWNLADHTADSLSSAWEQGPLKELPDNMWFGAIVCDGGSNFQLAGRQTLGEDSALLCICHGLNCGARAVAEKTGVKAVFDKLDRLINFVYGSSGRQERFSAAVRLNPPAGVGPRKLVRTGETRWLSYVPSYESYARLRDVVISFVLAESDGSADLLLTNDEFLQLQIVSTILQPFMRVCTAAQESCGATQTAVVHWLFSLRDCLTVEVVDGPIARAWKTAHLKELTDRFSSIFSCTKLLPFACAAIHPMYGHLPWVTPQKRDAIWEYIATQAEQLHTHLQGSRPQPEQPVHAPAGPAAVPVPVPAPISTSLYHCREDQMDASSVFRAQLLPALKSVRCLFESADHAQHRSHPPPGDERTLTDPFAFWRGFLKEKPELIVLLPVLRFLLSIPASSAFSERLWSSAGFLNNDRENLQAQNLVRLTVIRDWLQQLGRDSGGTKDRVIEALNEQIQLIATELSKKSAKSPTASSDTQLLHATASAIMLDD